MSEVPFNKWSFVDKNDLDNEHWYVRLEGGTFHGVIYRYMEIKLNEKATYVNLGDWITHFTYGMFDGKKVVLRKWETS